MATAIVSPEEVARLIPPVVRQAHEIVVRNAEDYEMACTFLQLVAQRRKQVEEVFDPIIHKAHEAHKEAVAQKRKFTDPLALADSEVRMRIGTYRSEQERLRRAEELRLAAEAKQQQDEQAIAEAAQLEQAGEHDLAAVRIEEAAQAPAPVVVVESAVPRVADIAARKNWKWRYKVGEEAALRALVKAAAADDRYLAYLEVRETAVGAAARTQKSLAQIPGIEIYAEDSVSVRAK
jgi:hypothetical protein